MREQPGEIGRRLGQSRGERRAVEGSLGCVEQRQHAPGREVGEINQKVGALGRSEQQAIRGHAGWGAEQPVVRSDLRDSIELGTTVADEDQPVGARVRGVVHAQAVDGWLHVKRRPDLAVDDGDWCESLHHLGVGLMNEAAGQPALFVEVEVAVLDQQRYLERRSLWQTQLALGLVAHDPQPGEPSVDVEPGDTHDVVVVPEQRRTLIHWVVEDGGLTRGEEVLRPAVVNSRGQATMQVHDRVAGQRCSVPVCGPTAESGEALYRHASRVCVRWGPGHHQRERALELVAPLDGDGVSPLGLDRRAGDHPLIAPNLRYRQVAVEAVLPRSYTHNETAVVILRDETLRQRQTIDERRELRYQRAFHGSDCADLPRPRGAPLASVDYCMKYDVM